MATIPRTREAIGVAEHPTVHVRIPDAHAPVLDGIPRLVERAQRNDCDAFGDLYRLYHGAVFRLARFHLGPGAEDVAAETFLRAWEALPRYRNTGAPFVAWLYGIARHVVADELASRRRVEPRAEPPDQSTNPGPDASVQTGTVRVRAMSRGKLVIVEGLGVSAV